MELCSHFILAQGQDSGITMKYELAKVCDPDEKLATHNKRSAK